MKHFLLSIEQPDGGAAPPEILEPVMRKVEAFNSELKAAGAWVFAGGLDQPAGAVVSRSNGGQVITTQGPYLQGDEHLGGLCIILAPDFDSALEWGKRLADATMLPVEVREFQGDPNEHLAD